MVQFIESELILLKKEINEMWNLVHHQLERAGESVMNIDKELAQQVMICEKRVNAFELKIDSDIEEVIALYNPVAIDLRFVLAMLKINSNLERLGDFAEGLARFVLKTDDMVLDKELLKSLRLKEMVDAVISMLDCTQQALIDEDLDKATSVFVKDGLVDEINADATKVLSDYIKQHPDSTLAWPLFTVFRTKDFLIFVMSLQ